MKLSRILIVLVPLALICVASAFLVTSLTASWTFFMSGLMGSGLVFVGMGVAALGCATTFERGKARGWMISGMVAALIASLLWSAVLIRGDLSPSTMEIISPIATLLTVWAALMMVIGWLLQPRLYTRLGVVARSIAIVMAVVIAATVVQGCVLYPHVERRFDWQAAEEFVIVSLRIGGASAIGLTCALVMMLIAMILPRIAGMPIERLVPQLEFQLKCPRCGLDQTMLTGADACRACGLRVKVTPS